MQPLGILLLTAGTWLVYSGVVGIEPLATIQKILANPAQASEIIAQARAESDAMSVQQITSAAVVRNPFASWKVSDTFAGHKARESKSPGIDFAVPVGTPIPAPVGGRLTNNPSGGAAGYYVEIIDSAGYRHQFMHISRFRDELNGTTVRAGTIIGYTGGARGAVGAGSSTGPHLHYNIITPTGAFIDPAEYLNRRSTNKAVAQ